MVIEAYYFLFFIAFLWTVFAVIQDIRFTEVSNWLNFSFVAIALGYRLFYSIFNDNYRFFWFGLLGFGIFFALAHSFYYGRAFGGGDAKLLMGYGAIIPFESYSGLLVLSLSFIFVFFLLGTLYSLAYSLFIIGKNFSKFKLEFKRKLKEKYYIAVIGVFLSLVLLALQFDIFGVIYCCFALLFTFLYYYVSVLDKLMVGFAKSKDLMEGDWLERDVKIGNHWIRKNVHGLSKKDIQILRKHNKEVLIKNGIPFTPAFLLTLFVMVFFFAFAKLNFLELLFLLF